MGSEQRPNIVFFFTDDQRSDTIRALGNRQIHTPVLDALVAGGTAFTNAYIMGGTSPAVCMPSRAMLHTGRTLFHIEGMGQGIPSGHTMLGEHLRGNGYVTFGTGKWHNGTEAFNRSFSNGAEILFGGMGDHWNVPAFDYDPSGLYDGQCPACPNPGLSNEVHYRSCDHIKGGTHSSELFADAALDFLDSREGDDDPFFLYLSFMAPHDPRTMPRRYLDMYDPDTIELPPSYMPEHPFDNGEMKIRDEMLEAWPRTREAIRRHTAEYFAMITHADAEMGRVITKLKQQGVYENTIIVFAGDNGLAVGRHGLMGKQSVYDHSVHVPLVFSGPGVSAGETSVAQCYLIDIFPTLCELAGVGVPESVEGTSLCACIDDTSTAHRDHLLFAYRHLHRGVQDGRWKLIECVVDGTRTTQVFDLIDDPFETNDLSGTAMGREHGDRLRLELAKWRLELDDTSDEFWAAVK